jgi:glycosyltransferase involved in cell wall biosynthesis
MRTIILTYSHFDVSGIQTQMLLLANAAVDMGIPVVIFALKGGLEAFLDDRVIFIEPENYHKSYDQDITRYVLKHKLINPIIWASHPYELARLFAISRRLARVGVTCSTCVGVYHPRACFKPEDSILTEIICRLNFRAAEPQQVYFMSNAVKQSHEKRWGLFAKPHKVVPIILPDRTRQQPKHDTCRRIVSIGRLVPWKSYNTSIPKIAKALSDKRQDFVWDVYGDGPLLDVLQQELDTLGVCERLKLRGSIDFSDLDMALSGADLFVGMGTSMLEAAIRRIPCIVAVDSSATHCYGMLPDVPVGNVGELQSHAPNVAIQDLVQEFLDLSSSQQRVLGDQCYQIARSQTLTPEVFATKLQELPQDRANRLVKLFASTILQIYRGIPRPTWLLKGQRHRQKNTHG